MQHVVCYSEGEDFSEGFQKTQRYIGNGCNSVDDPEYLIQNLFRYRPVAKSGLNQVDDELLVRADFGS
jgi:hypothetical protein